MATNICPDGNRCLQQSHTSTVYLFDDKFQIGKHYDYPGVFKNIMPSNSGGFFMNWTFPNTTQNALRKTDATINILWGKKPFIGLFMPKPDESLIGITNPIFSGYTGNIVVYKIDSDGRSFETLR